jgi:polyhydroxybutyrate depolymerase
VPRRGLTRLVVVALAVVACSGGDDRAEDGPDASGTGAETPAPPSPSPSAGCDGPATEQADLAESTFASDGVDRRYLLSAPAWAEGDEPLPLVVDFHGLAEGADVHAQMTQLGPLGVEEGFVALFPHATGEPVAWDVTPDVADNADLRYVAALLDRVEAGRCVDTARVYATGLSNGAMMASTVACTMADRFAAVAPIAGITRPEPCDADRPVPVLSIHGTADPILLFNGGFNAAALGDVLGGDPGAGATTTTTAAPDLDGEGYPATVRAWAEANGCEAEPEDEPVGEEVIRRRYDCPDDGPVVFYIVEGGGHSWPSSELSRSIEGIVGPTTFDIDASREVWDFVRELRIEP